jgi:putative transposase
MQNIQPLKKGFKYRIYPNQQQKEILIKIFGASRFVYNYFLDKNKKEYEDWKTGVCKTRPVVNAFQLMVELPLLKQREEFKWLNDCPAQILQSKISDLNNAFQRFFKNGGYPRFKSKHFRQSVEFNNQNYKIKDSKLQLLKTPDLIKINWHRELSKGKITRCVISMEPTGEFYASFTCEYTPVKTNGSGIVGLDAGITDLATTSTGETFENPRHYVNAQKKLTKLQRKLSKKKKGSKNRNKARLKVAKHHFHIANQRKDYMHKLTTRLVRENQAVAIESLQVKNMVKNHKLAKHITDAGWGMMREQLVYKTIASNHCKLILADPYYPSTQLCSDCGVKPAERVKLGVTKWTCCNCGSVHERDHNAAKNLEQLALRELLMAKQMKSDKPIILAGRYTPV